MTAVRGSLFAPTRERAVVLAWLLGVTVAAVGVWVATTRPWAMDAHTFWAVQVSPTAYDQAPGTTGAFLYSPVFAQAMQAVNWLPWPVFAAQWAAAGCAVYWWATAPLPWSWRAPLLALAVEDVTIGQTSWVMVAAMVLGVRVAAWWLLPALMKVTLGVGVVWHVARGAWRQVAVAAAVGAVVLVVSVLGAPDMWSAWFAFLTGQDKALGAAVRVVAAAVLVWWAARTGRAWVLPFALILASPVIAVYSLAMLCALPRLLPDTLLERARAPFPGVRGTVRAALDL